MTTLELYFAISGAAMQINRLDHIFLPGTTATAKPSALEVSDTSVDSNTQALSSGAATVAHPSSAASDIPTSEATQDIPPSVTLTLSVNQKADTSNTYSLESIAAASTTARSPLVLNQTPAEQFVASAVRIMHDLEQGKTDALGPDAASFNQVSASKLASAFGSLRQAAAKLNVFA
ncbi:hypothetical protein [Rhodoferax sp.]|uniref:hypothetical protein n=1 Tax=Rhodoferax sp. TaxID=50421 RepID=UPI00284013B8|nr:hypothetical protein [Rhodoferax sp.]MDR3371429.1 hypothetical protein [Rhodoferax sp.]